MDWLRISGAAVAAFFALQGAACDEMQPPDSRELRVEARGGDGRCEAIPIEPDPGAESAEIPCETVHVPSIEDDDFDRDGESVEVDPDDFDPRVFSGAGDYPCDGVDQNGDGVDPCTPDLDGDDIRAAEDCDDLDASIHPLAAEIRCNGIDENCDDLDDCDRDFDGVFDAYDPDPDDPAVGPPPPGRDRGDEEE